MAWLTERQAPERLPENPPYLMQPVRIRVLRAFCVAGRRVEPDERHTLTRFDATSMAALGKVELLE